jgi:hypothetical protein
MKQFVASLHRAWEKLGESLLSKSTLARRAVLRSAARERAASEAERLDRLRNPRDYQGR